MLKKLAIIAAALAVSAPAFADRGHGNARGYAYGHRTLVVQQPRHVVYRPAPRPVYVVQRRDSVLPLLAGAVIGAAIVQHAVSGY